MSIDAESAALRERLQRLARLLDSAVRIPGTRIRVGVDALVGLIPGVGDLAGLFLGLWLIWQARQMRAPAGLQGRMIGNLAIEAVLGSVPLVGDIFDVAWRANQRNVELLLDWSAADSEESRPPRRPRWIAGAAALALLGLAAWLWSV